MHPGTRIQAKAVRSQPDQAQLGSQGRVHKGCAGNGGRPELQRGTHSSGRPEPCQVPVEPPSGPFQELPVPGALGLHRVTPPQEEAAPDLISRVWLTLLKKGDPKTGSPWATVSCPLKSWES